MNLANKITITRIFLIPVFLVLMLIEFKYHNFLAAAVFIIAASTDSLDGYIARKRNLITNFGKFIDPLADKLLVTSALIVLVSKGQVPALVAIIIISREFIIIGFRLLASSEGVVLAASWLGKVKTVTQIVAIIAIIIGNFPFNYINFPFDIIVLYISVIFTVISAVDYIYKNRKLVKED